LPLSRGRHRHAELLGERDELESGADARTPPPATIIPAGSADWSAASAASTRAALGLGPERRHARELRSTSGSISASSGRSGPRAGNWRCTGPGAPDTATRKAWRTCRGIAPPRRPSRSHLVTGSNDGHVHLWYTLPGTWCAARAAGERDDWRVGEIRVRAGPREIERADDLRHAHARAPRGAPRIVGHVGGAFSPWTWSGGCSCAAHLANVRRQHAGTMKRASPP